MDDDGRSNGLSGWAGVTLGRMWAEHERSMDETAHWFANRHNRPVSPAVLQAQNQALAAENVQLRQALSDYEVNYGNLKAWADRAEAKIELLLKERG